MDRVEMIHKRDRAVGTSQHEERTDVREEMVAGYFGSLRKMEMVAAVPNWVGVELCTKAKAVAVAVEHPKEEEVAVGRPQDAAVPATLLSTCSTKRIVIEVRPHCHPRR